MSLIFSGWREMSAEAVNIAREGVFTILSRARVSANGAFEAIAGSPAPGRSAAAVMAHDHTESGGGAILPRGVVWNMDNGDGDGWEWIIPLASAPITEESYFYSFANAADTRVPTLRLWTTDGINNTRNNGFGDPCALEGKMIVYLKNDNGANSNDFTFKFRNESTLELSDAVTQNIAASSDDVVELSFGEIPLSRTSGLQELTLLVTSDYHGKIRLQSLVIAETRETSQPVSGGAYRYNSTIATTRPGIGAAANNFFNDWTGLSTKVTTTPYTISGGKQFILVDTSASAMVVNLPDATLEQNNIFVILDCTGDANTNNITVSPDGTQTIDGNTGDFTMTKSRQSLILTSDGVGWEVGELT